MIGAALQLIRTSLASVVVLVVSLVTLANLLTDTPEDTGAGAERSIPSLNPLPALQKPAATAVTQSALFDPGRRAETISGSVDDLRAATEAAASPVTIAGVLLAGRSRKAMLSLGGAAPAWNGVGADLGGWRVASIDAEGAVLERDGQSVALKVADRYKLHGKPQAGAGEAMPGPEGSAPPAPPPPAAEPSPPPMP